MDNNESFVFYASFWDALDGMSEEMQFHILRAVIEYGLRGAEPEGLNAFEDMAFRLIRPQLGAVEELEADCGDDLGDLRRRVVEARDAYEDALDAVADLCEESAERWKSYVEKPGEE